MELTYTQNGDYLIPNLTLTNQPSERIGKYGRMRKAYLKEHRKGTYNALLLTGGLTEHLLETDRTAREQVEQTARQMATAEGVNEALKASDQMTWVRRMNSIRHRAEEAAIAETVRS